MTMNNLLCVDFGSTFTKVTAIDVKKAKIIGVSKAFTTISTDVVIGFDEAIASLQKQCGPISFDQKLACSSAAGGLKMISCGLVPDLTAKASKLAAASAGAKILRTFAYELSATEREEIVRLEPDIVLLCGGIDGGNREVIVHNARVLASIPHNFSVIVAGNKAVGDEVREILMSAGKRTLLTENVMPKFGDLNIEPAKQCVRELFIENIIEAKGLGEVQKKFNAEIIPTPLAVYDAMVLLANGSKHTKGIGELMAYDVGGATTDVYSVASGHPTQTNVVVRGLPEPYAKRSVEGDIGMRYSMDSLMAEIGVEELASSLKLNQSDVLDWVKMAQRDPAIVPEEGSVQADIDQELGKFCVDICSVRHCGSFEKVFTPFGETTVQTGKDLTQIRTVVGTGGILVNSKYAAKLLQGGCMSEQNYESLRPRNPNFLLDRKNILAAMGLLSRVDAHLALEIMKQELIPV